MKTTQMIDEVLSLSAQTAGRVHGKKFELWVQRSLGRDTHSVLIFANLGLDSQSACTREFQSIEGGRNIGSGSGGCDAEIDIMGGVVIGDENIRGTLGGHIRRGLVGEGGVGDTVSQGVDIADELGEGAMDVFMSGIEDALVGPAQQRVIGVMRRVN